MNCVQRTIAAEMARPIPVRMCLRGCGMPAHHGGCKGEERFAMVDGVRRCAMCPHRLANSNPGPLCRGCQAKALNERIALRERVAVAAEREEASKPRKDRPRGEVATPVPKAALAGVCTIRIEAIPESAEGQSETSELFARMLALEDGEALVIPLQTRKQIYRACDRLRKRLNQANAGRLRWKRDGLTLYAWRDRGAK